MRPRSALRRPPSLRPARPPSAAVSKTAAANVNVRVQRNPCGTLRAGESPPSVTRQTTRLLVRYARRQAHAYVKLKLGQQIGRIRQGTIDVLSLGSHLGGRA